jgi:outer membrane protein
MKKTNSKQTEKSSMFKIPRWILVLLVLNLGGVISIGVFMLATQKKTAFVDLGKLYEGFELNKQRQTELQSMSIQFKNTLDSMALEIQSMESSLQANYDRITDEKLQVKKMNYYKIEENMQAKLEETKVKSDEQIWLQINTYTQEFGKEKGYDYIYGGNGTGSLMYANDSKDISEDVLVYINKKFAGE